MRKLVIRNLYDEINTDISCIRVRRNRIRVILVKKEIKTWYSLTSNK